ncbi:MAG: hypothetical protein UT24_C0005G0002 [Candidatus Woesebacteria bacterium GW2011_GWB1_39_12]|uniref:Uncharacterized protein n=2 Tax=Candidatus Woeseibacteriota TaxID=1752722 RepID=A0A0G0PIR7_9BACT|nr:MAG: hypothetical protein UT23_C0006G0025 [Candidatus Woesebacteria bacterium GW2011_GWA1_39_12]KKR01293.1 MAG: hypothetical protein UT24_C0005G0002 [Candidatus Woesebacteria bacterium GW2011_GWB1_39_12]
MKKNSRYLIFIALVLLLILFVSKTLNNKPNFFFNKNTKPTITSSENRQESFLDASKLIKSSQKINDNGDLLISETKNYKVIYFPKNNQVFVSILSSPFSKFREEAEKELLEVLDIDSDTSCKLNVLITTPRFVNPEEAGKEYVLSFCE